MRKLGFLAAVLAVLAASSACQRRPEAPPELPADGGRPVEATSLAGEPLRRPDLPEDFRVEQEALLEEAEARLETAGGDREARLDAMVWVGRRLGYLGRYREALDVYTQALEVYPDEPRLLRHRGHRYLTTRRLPLAIVDFERAAALIEGQPDRIEADGLPNARNQPTSTLGTNVYYHLGLAHYLRGDWRSAEAAYRRCLELSTNPDMAMATTYWLALTLRRADPASSTEEGTEVAALLETARPELDIIENHAYHRLLLAYGAQLELKNLLEEEKTEGDAAFATTGYGVAAWFELEGEGDAAHEIWRDIVATSAWPSFGYLAAEADLARRAAAKPFLDGALLRGSVAVCAESRLASAGCSGRASARSPRGRQPAATPSSLRRAHSSTSHGLLPHRSRSGRPVTPWRDHYLSRAGILVPRRTNAPVSLLFAALRFRNCLR